MVLDNLKCTHAAESAADRLPRNIAGAAACVMSLAGALLIALTHGNSLIVPALVAGCLFVFLVIRHLEWGIYVLLAAVLTLNQFLTMGIESAFAMLAAKFYLNLNSTTGIGALIMNPVELLLVLVMAGWLLRAAVTRQWRLHPVENGGIALVFLLTLVFYTFYGLGRGGGDWRAALWEIRPLYYLCITYFLSSQVITAPRQVRVCVWIIVLGLGFKGLQGCWRFFVDLRADIGALRSILSHEDSLFLVTGFMLLAAFWFLGYRGKEWRVLIWTLPANLITFIINQRRITYGVAVLCAGILVALLPARQRRSALRLAIPVAVLFAVYTAAFWNSSGLKAMPAQKIKSVFVEQEGTADHSSNIWRELELFNLKETVRAFPMGVGFGQKYLIVLPYPDIGEHFPLWEYIPHCAIYWIWVKSGFLGFTVFWLFFGVAVTQAVIDYRFMRDPYYKALALMVMLFIVGQIIVAYYDLQITYYRNMVYLGIAMGLGRVIRRMDQSLALPAAENGDARA